MAGEENIIDIITRLSYQTNAAALQKDIELFNKYNTNIEELQRKLNRLKSDQQQTTNIIDQKAIREGITQTTAALNQQAAAMQRLVATSKPLQEAVKKEAGLIGQLQNQLKQLQNTRTEATSEAAIAGYNRQIDAVQARLNRLTGANGGSGGITRQIGQGLLSGLGIGAGFGIVTRGVSEITQLISESAQLARQAEGVQDAFNRLNAPDLLNNLREATKGTLSDLQLMQKAVEFNNFGLPIQRLGELLEFARVRARETGLSIDYVTNSLVSGIARQSPRILDNLGLSQREIREEFKRIGNFADAAFNIINREAERANSSLLTTQDRLDQITAKVKNAETEFGQIITSLQLVGIDIARVFSFDGTKVEDFKSLAGEYVDNVRAMGEEAKALTLVEIQQRGLFNVKFKQFADQYVSADFNSRKTIEKQAAEMYEELFKTETEFQKKSGNANDIYFRGLKLAYQQAQASFRANRLNIDTLQEGDIRNLSGADINELQTQINRRRDILSREDKKDEEAFKRLNSLSKALAEEESIRSGKEDSKALKSAESLADKRLKLEADLQKRIAELRDENNKSFIAAEQKSLSTIIATIESEYEEAISKLDTDRAEAERKKLLTEKSISQFDQAKGLIASTAGNRISNAEDSAARQLQKTILQDEIRFMEERQKLRTVDFSNDVALEQKKTIAEIAEINDRYDKQALLTKIDSEERIQIQKNRENAILLAEEKGLQAQLDVYNKFLDELNAKTDSAYSIILGIINSDAAKQVGALQDQYLSGDISYASLQRKSGRISRDNALNIANGNIAGTNDKIADAERIRRELQAQATAGIDVQKQLDQNQATLNKLNEELAKFKDDAVAAKSAIEANRNDEFQKQLGLLDTLVSATAQAYNQINSIQQASLDREISIREDRVRQAERLADRGNTEALRREQEYLRQAQNQREQAARRQIVINSALTTSEAILGVVSAASQGDPYTLAARVIAAVIAIGAGISSVSAATRNGTSGLAGFKDGVIDLQGPGNGRSDSITARLSRGESVMTADETQRFYNTLSAMRAGTNPAPALAKDLGWNYAAARQYQQGVSRGEFAALTGEMRAVKEAIIDNRVGVHTSIQDGQFTQMVERVQSHTKHTMRG